jgi:uroporphyrinogen decarboxylase
MSSRNLVRQTLTFENPKRVPRQLWLLPWAAQHYPTQSQRISQLYPDDIIQCPPFYKSPPKISGGKFTKGTYVDEWGCVFHNPEEGVMGIVSKPLIESWDQIDLLQPPQELLNLDIEAINSFCRNHDQFIYAGNIIRPFERFQFIRTMEQSFLDVMFEEEGYLELIQIIHQHFLKEVEAWAQTDIDAIFLMDDWGTQNGLMVSPMVFKNHFKSMYRDYCEIAKSYGKFVFMHSDGNISDIMNDLIEVGIDCLNSQLFCMNIAELGQKHAGKITFWGEIDRQNLLPDGTPDQIEEAVKLIYNNLWQSGGLIAQCEFGLAAKPENIELVFKTFNNILP